MDTEARSVTVRRLDAPEPALIPGLAALLQDAVHGGASVGFLAPVAPQTAARHWERAFAGLAGSTRLWVAECAGSIVGSVQLQLCDKENGRHRAEVQKLLVHSAERGRGIGSQLLRSVETFAREQARTLLVLDTLRGSVAEAMYRRHGWQFVGYVPDYAAKPDGALEATAVFYKQITPV